MTAADLREQRISRWEQLRDDESGRLYFFFKVKSSYVFSAVSMSRKLSELLPSRRQKVAYIRASGNNEFPRRSSRVHRSGRG